MMRPTVTTDKPVNLSQLDQELGGHGLCADFNNPGNKVILTAEGSPVTLEELQSAVDAHVAEPEPEPSVAEKLASVGITMDDLRQALGLTGE